MDSELQIADYRSHITDPKPPVALLSGRVCFQQHCQNASFMHASPNSAMVARASLCKRAAQQQLANSAGARARLAPLGVLQYITKVLRTLPSKVMGMVYRGR